MRDEASTEAGTLTQAEMSAAIAALTPVDFGRLDGAARSFGALAGMSRKDLLQDAFVRALVGRRKCPRNTPVVVFLIGVMRSMVSSRRKSVDATRVDTTADEPSGAPAVSRYHQPVETAAEAFEEEQFRKAQVERLFELFQDDEDACMWMMARMEAETLAEAQAIAGFDATKMNTVGRRVRRRSAREFSRGVQP